MKLKCVFSDKDIDKYGIRTVLGQKGSDSIYFNICYFGLSSLSAFPPIMIIFLDAVMDILFSYRNALCSWWSLFCYVHT